MKKIEHQLKNRNFYFPNWPIKHLFIGTFNPKGGEEVRYYYGRLKNRTWDLLSTIFDTNLNPNDEFFLEAIKNQGIGCVDMIDTICAPDKRLKEILGEGYKDSKIINTSTQRDYNTKAIIDLIEKNKGVKVYSTWGKGPKLKEWLTEIIKIENRIELVSPSMAAKVPKGAKKFDFMLNDWSSKISL